MPKHIQGIDHVVILAADLDRAAETYARLGFTLSPRGVHSDHMGSANHTIILQDDYFEVLSVLKPTPSNATWRARLETGEGLWAMALKTDDAAGMADEMRAAGYAVRDMLDFERPVDLPDGTTGTAAFKVTHFNEPGSVFDGIFACQQLTRETVWLPELMEHANGAVGIEALEALAADPKAVAGQLSALFETEPVTGSDGILSFRAGPVTLRVRLGDAGGWPIRFTGLTLAVSDLARTEAAMAGLGAERDGDTLRIAPRLTHGVALGFTPGP
jgi:catechol 2,3-dioxygenase-like lactoylglutathione lyase family enzyme